MKKPVVGVMPLWDDEKESLWMLPGYFDGIITNGAIPIMLPLTEDKGDLEQTAELCDGFLFTGGHDVSPEIYGEKPLDGLVSSNTIRDKMEFYILKLNNRLNNLHVQFDKLFQKQLIRVY